MTRNLFIFLATFLAGGLIALVARAAFFNPSAEQQDQHPAEGGNYPAMVSNPLAPTPPTATKKAPAPSAPAGTPASADPHAGHAAPAGQPVNTVCAICGMDVDPALPTVQYQGQTIGFGCRMCPPKFEANPDRYGPAYLKNEVIQR